MIVASDEPGWICRIARDVQDFGLQPGPADLLLGRIAGRFARVEPRRRAKAFVLGLLADLPCKNCWMIAEHADSPQPSCQKLDFKQANCANFPAVRSILGWPSS
jgi:hypothetical protein